MTIMITAISPGVMKLRDSRSSLNQTRGRTSSGGRTGGAPVRRSAASATSWENVWTTSSA